MIDRYSREKEIPDVDPEKIRAAEHAKNAMQRWRDEIRNQYKEEKASVNLNPSSEEILELHTKHDYIRIVYNPSDNAERPFQQFAFHSKDEFNDEKLNPVDMPRYVNLTKESVDKIVLDLKGWLKAQNENNVDS